MKLNYIRLAASVLILMANIIGGGSEETDIRAISKNEIKMPQLINLKTGNNYKYSNTIFPTTTRITIP